MEGGEMGFHGMSLLQDTQHVGGNKKAKNKHQ